MYKTHTIKSIHHWHALARPKPDNRAFNVQLGCHFEEIAEMTETIFSSSPEFVNDLERLHYYAGRVANQLKKGEAVAHILDRKEFIDSVADQVVTGIGSAYCANMNSQLAIERVNTSNWSKYMDGKPVFDANGKIAKPPTYREPDLEGCY